MKYALFSVPVGTIYDLPQPIKEGETGPVSTIGDEGLYGQACQVRTAPGGVTAAGVHLAPDVAEVVSFYGYHGYVFTRELQFIEEAPLRDYLAEPMVLAGRATDVLNLPKVQGVRMMELERGGLLRRVAEAPEEAEAHKGWAKVRLVDGRVGYVRDVALEPVRYEMSAVFSQEEGLPFDEALAKQKGIPAAELVQEALNRWYGGSEEVFRAAVCEQAKKYMGTEYRWAANPAGALTARALSAAPTCSAASSFTGMPASWRAGPCTRCLLRKRSRATPSSSRGMWRSTLAAGGISTPREPRSAAAWCSTVWTRRTRSTGKIWSSA